MSDAAAWLGFLTAGLLATPHCLAMCGPLLCGFARLVDSGGDGAPSGLLAYHAGRVWTYSLLGLIAGMLGSQVESAMYRSWQIVAIAVAVTLAAGLWFGKRRWRGGPQAEWLRRQAGRWSWLRSLAATPGLQARFLLGALMGLLPCGVVYAMLIPAATMGSPPAAAAGMLLFGLGTVPSLSVGSWILTRPGSRRPWVRRVLGPAVLFIAACVVLLRLQP